MSKREKEKKSADRTGPERYEVRRARMADQSASRPSRSGVPGEQVGESLGGDVDERIDGDSLLGNRHLTDMRAPGIRSPEHRGWRIGGRDPWIGEDSGLRWVVSLHAYPDGTLIMF
jgi:hypothetical protein